MADLVITTGSVLNSTGGNISSDKVASVALTQGQSVYVNSSNQWAKAQADTQAHSGFGVLFGICLNAAAAGQKISVFIPTGTSAQINLGATLVLGKVYVISNANAGGIAPITDLGSGQFETILGLAVTTSLLDMVLAYSTGLANP